MLPPSILLSFFCCVTQGDLVPSLGSALSLRKSRPWGCVSQSVGPLGPVQGEEGTACQLQLFLISTHMILLTNPPARTTHVVQPVQG